MRNLIRHISLIFSKRGVLDRIMQPTEKEKEIVGFLYRGYMISSLMFDLKTRRFKVSIRKNYQREPTFSVNTLDILEETMMKIVDSLELKEDLEKVKIHALSVRGMNTK